MAPLNSPTDKLSEHCIQTLTKAARISCLVVTGPTIGPNSTAPPVDSPPRPSVQPKTPNDNAARSVSATAASATTPATVPDEPKSRWRYDAWRSVDPTADAWRPSATTLTLSDCRAVRFSMDVRSAEKRQRQIVREKQQQRQSQYDELIGQLERFRIDSTAHALEAVRRATLAKEECILAAARQCDEEARAADDQRRREFEAHRRRMLERTARLRRDEEIRGYFEAIKSSKNLFIVVFEKLVKTILLNQQSLPQFGEYSAQQEAFLQRYSQLLAGVNQGQIGADEVAALEALCDEMQALQRRIDAAVSESGERLAQMMAQQAAEAQRRQEEQQQQQNAAELEQQQQQHQQQNQQPPPLPPVAPIPQADSVDATATAVDAVPGAATTVDPPPTAQFVHPDRLAVYTETVDFYEQYKLIVKPLQADDARKTYRFNCQKAVNIPLNAISAVSAQHLTDKFDKLCALLGGIAVPVGDTAVSAGEHPLGVRFCSLLAAKKLVNQADSIISTDPKHAFPIAAVIVAVWQRFPDMGRLCMAYLYKESPYLAPYCVPHRTGESAEAYLQTLGYRCVGGQLEDNELYLKRQTGLVRLYAAIVVSQPRRGQTAEHPHGLCNGWLWLAHFANLDPLPEISATLLHEFLVVAGADLWRTYGQQFHKLLVALYQQYLVKLSKVDRGGPRARLEALLVRMLQERRIDEPDGKLPANFW